MKGKFVKGKLLLFMLITGLSLQAQDFMVDYVDGIVDLRDGTSWLEVFAGDTLTGNSTLRLSEGSIVELSTPQRTVTLSKGGTYNLGNLRSDPVTSVGLGSMITGRLRDMVTSDRKTQSAVMGVRASEAVQKEELSWMSSESEEFIQSGKEKLKSLDLPAALEDFEIAYDFAVDYDEEREANAAAFYLAFVYNMLDQNGQSLSYLQQVEAEPEADFYEEFIILKGSLLVESLNYDSALSLFASYQAEYSSVQTRQTVKILEAMALLGRDERSKAKTSFQEAYQIDPNSETGVLARKQFEEL